MESNVHFVIALIILLLIYLIFGFNWIVLLFGVAGLYLFNNNIEGGGSWYKNVNNLYIHGGISDEIFNNYDLLDIIRVPRPEQDYIFGNRNVYMEYITNTLIEIGSGRNYRATNIHINENKLSGLNSITYVLVDSSEIKKIDDILKYATCIGGLSHSKSFLEGKLIIYCEEGEDKEKIRPLIYGLFKKVEEKGNYIVICETKDFNEMAKLTKLKYPSLLCSENNLANFFAEFYKRDRDEFVKLVYDYVEFRMVITIKDVQVFNNIVDMFTNNKEKLRRIEPTIEVNNEIGEKLKKSMEKILNKIYKDIQENNISLTPIGKLPQRQRFLRYNDLYNLFNAQLDEINKSTMELKDDHFKDWKKPWTRFGSYEYIGELKLN